MTATILQFPARPPREIPASPPAAAPGSDEERFIASVRAGAVPGLERSSDAALVAIFRRLAPLMGRNRPA